MATIIWKAVDKTKCVYTGAEADLLEERAYLDEPIPGAGQAFRVLSRKCSLATECNLAGFACQWAYTNPGRDPFTEERSSGR